MKLRLFILLTLFLFTLSPAFAQKLANPILLWPQGAPGATGSSDEDKPAIIPFVPDAAKNTGAAMLVIPGGGFMLRAVDHEGVLVAQWLKERGITAFLLRYRLRPLYERKDWLLDAQRGMQFIRANAKQYNLSPNRIGAVGFSAGAMLAADIGFNVSAGKSDASDSLDRVSSRPDFVVLAYGSMPMPAEVNAAHVPPFFLYGTQEDVGQTRGMLDLYSNLLKAKVPAEAHFFVNGVHGTGFAVGDPILGEWPQLMLRWVNAGGFLSANPRVPLSGVVKLDGTPLLRGVVILTPVAQPTAPPVIMYITNAHTGELGSFDAPATLGPVAGKYRVEVRQDATRWESNSRNAFMLKIAEKQRTRSLTDEDRKAWGEFVRKRDLSPSIENQRVFRRQRPNDKNDYVIEIKNGANKINLEVFSR